MFSSFSKFLPTNVAITTPDFLKSASLTTTNTPEASSPSTDAKHRNVLTKRNGPPQGAAEEPGSQFSTTDMASVNESENVHNVENSSPKAKNESRGRKRKDATTATETFYIVRPPPSKTNHPLNLQVQLLATSGRERIERRSASQGSTRNDGLTRSATGSRETLNDTEEGNGLKRTASIRSNRSDSESIYSSASTASTNASTASSSSGRRMIPLYNLHAHNVMTNSIADAGTDAKIAKFFKRGLEIMGLAVLEPVEVYGKYTWDDTWDSLSNSVPGVSTSTQVSRTVSHISARSLHRTVSPKGSMILPNHNGSPSELTPVIEAPSSPTTPKAPSPPQPEKDVSKRLFGGIFNKKKKEPPTPLPLDRSSSLDTNHTESAAANTTRSSKRHSATPSLTISSPLPSAVSGITLPDTPFSGGGGSAISNAGDVLLQPQILGLQAVLQSPSVPPKGRPSAYVWVIRKWIRGGDEGFLGLGAVVESLGIGSGNTAVGMGAAGGMEVEVRFEWKRGAKGKMGAPGGKEKEKDRKASRRHSVATEGQCPPAISVGTSGMLDPSSAEAGLSTSPASKRLSFQGFGLGKRNAAATLPSEITNGSHDQLKVSRAPSPNPPASITTIGTNEDSKSPQPAHGALVEESESESDIEDSERPWNCYLHIRGALSSRVSSRDELAVPSSHQERERENKTLDIRLRIAALAPAPHHPKVIAQIKTPYPLPDVLFDAHKTTAELRMRSDPDGSRPDLTAENAGGGRGAKPIVLSSEDVKDVVSCTGLWLVVREGYGGLARKRKGDGWRLRG